MGDSLAAASVNVDLLRGRQPWKVVLAVNL